MSEVTVSEMPSLANLNTQYIALDNAIKTMSSMSRLNTVSQSSVVSSDMASNMLKVATESIMVSRGIPTVAMEGRIHDIIVKIIDVVYNVINKIIQTVYKILITISDAIGITAAITHRILNVAHLANSFIQIKKATGVDYITLTEEEVTLLESKNVTKYVSFFDHSMVEPGAVNSFDRSVSLGYYIDMRGFEFTVNYISKVIRSRPGVVSTVRDFIVEITNLFNQFDTDYATDNFNDFNDFIDEQQKSLKRIIVKFNKDMVTDHLHVQKCDLPVPKQYMATHPAIVLKGDTMAGANFLLLHGDGTSILKFLIYDDVIPHEPARYLPLFAVDDIAKYADLQDRVIGLLKDSKKLSTEPVIRDALRNLDTVRDIFKRDTPIKDNTHSARIQSFVTMVTTAYTQAIDMASRVDLLLMSFLQKSQAAHKDVFDMLIKKAREMTA